MRYARGKGRRATAGIIASVIMFAMLFTVGTSYFIFVNSTNSQYVKNLVSASNKMQGAIGESLLVTTLLAANGDVAFYVNNTSGQNINMTVVYVLASSGGMLRCDGVGLPASAGCSNTSPTLWAVVNAGRGSPATGTYDTGYLYVSGTTDTVKILTQRGNTYSATYPNSAVNQAVQAETAQAMTVNLATYKWIQLLPQPTSLVQTKFVQNCDAANCAAAYTSNVAAGNTLIYALGWYGSNPPATPTDTLGDSFTIATSNSVYGPYNDPGIVQTKYNKNCNAANCALAYTSSVSKDNILVYALGWSGNSPPSTPTDTLGNTYTLGVSNSVASTVGVNPSVVQKTYNRNCNSANCALAYTSNVVAGNLLVYGLGWYNQLPPSTPTDTRGSTFTLAVSSSVAVTTAPTQVQVAHTHELSCTNCAQAYSSSVTAGNVLVYAIGWYDSSAPATPTDTLGDSFTLGTSQSVAGGGHTYYSYIWYATAKSSGANTVTATFGGAVTATPWVYEISGASVSGVTSSTGSSSGGSTSLSVTSFTPGANSLVIANAETGASTSVFTAGAGYTLDGTCSSHYNCAEHKASQNGATTAPMSIAVSATWVETAIAFTPSTYFSYIWYATAPTSGADTITAAFSPNAVAGSVSIYELNSYTTAGLLTSTGTSTGSTSVSVTSFTAPSNSISIGNVETGSAATTYTKGGGYTVVKGGGAGCDDNNAAQGCNEYKEGASGALTVPWTLSASTAWAESAICFAPAPVTYYSYIWYATAASSGADTITAAFSSTVTGSVSIYELKHLTAAGLLTSTGSSSAGSGTASVTSFTPITNSVVIGNVEDNTVDTNYGAGGGYTVIQGGGGGCGSAYGCSEWNSLANGATTVSMNLGGAGNPPWVESAISFGPGYTTFYSYIWYAVALTSGADTITAAFSATTTGTISMYELGGYSTSGIIASGGNSSAGSTTASVTSFNAYDSSIVISNVETGNSGEAITAGAGFTVILGGGGGCGASWGCSQYSTTQTDATTAPMTLNPSTVWTETAIIVGATINPGSGYQVGGYPSMGVPDHTKIAWRVNFTNTDAQHRSVTLWPQSEVAVDSIKDGGKKHNDYYIISSVNPGVTGIVPYPSTPGSFTTVLYGGQVTLWFAATTPLSSKVDVLDYTDNQPYQAFFSLTGMFGDGRLYGETIPYPSGIIHNRNAQESVSAGPTGTVVTVTCTGSCGYRLSSPGIIGWIDGSGKTTTLASFQTNNQGKIPPGTTFTVPAASPGYYTIMITDYLNTFFLTFQHT